MRDQGNATIGVGESDKAVVENVLLTYDTNKRLQKEQLAEPFAIDVWTIEFITGRANPSSGAAVNLRMGKARTEDTEVTEGFC
jgi:hypothetical protein